MCAVPWCGITLVTGGGGGLGWVWKSTMSVTPSQKFWLRLEQEFSNVLKMRTLMYSLSTFIPPSSKTDTNVVAEAGRLATCTETLKSGGWLNMIEDVWQLIQRGY